jgi:hypothetical protein
MPQRVPSPFLLLGLLAACGGGAGDAETTAATEETSKGGFLRVDETLAAEREPDAPPTVEIPAPKVVPGHLPSEERSAHEAMPAVEASPAGPSLEDQAREALGASDGASAARLLSQLVTSHLDSGADDRAALARWSAMLREAQELHRWSKKGSWRAVEARVQPGDGLIAIRKRVLASHPEILICTGQIARANDLGPDATLRPETDLRVPVDRASMLIDLSAMWAFYRLGDELVAGWEIGVGKDGSQTQPGTYTIGLKQENPMWCPLGREPVPFGDPQNPLGTRWLAWHIDGRSTSLGIHGTNDPSGVGRRVSEGCIRMRNPEVEELFEILPLGAEIRVQP